MTIPQLLSGFWGIFFNFKEKKLMIDLDETAEKRALRSKEITALIKEKDAAIRRLSRESKP